MKILFIVHGYPPHDAGGIEQYSFNLINRLKNKFQVYIFTKTQETNVPDYHTTDETIEGVKIRRVNNTLDYKTFYSFYSNVFIERIFEDYIKKIKPDLVHIQHLFGLSLNIIDICHSYGIPIILTLHDFYYLGYRVNFLKYDGSLCHGPFYENFCQECIENDFPQHKIGVLNFSQILGYKRFLEVQKKLKKIDNIIVFSRFVWDKYIEHIPELSHKLIHIPLGIEKERILHKFYKTKSRKIRFGFIGSLYPSKGIELLIKAFRELREKEATLNIHGTGREEYLRYLEKIILGKKIFLKGKFDNRDIGTILSRIDVLIVPSNVYETYSTVISEAKTVKIPIIVSNIRTQKDRVKNDVEGLHFEHDNSEDLKNKIKFFIENPRKIREYSQNINPDKITSLREHIKALEKVYTEHTHARTGLKKAHFIEQLEITTRKKIENIVVKWLDTLYTMSQQKKIQKVSSAFFQRAIIFLYLLLVELRVNSNPIVMNKLIVLKHTYSRLIENYMLRIFYHMKITDFLRRLISIILTYS